jgi:hypothetical protein
MPVLRLVSSENTSLKRHTSRETLLDIHFDFLQRLSLGFMNRQSPTCQPVRPESVVQLTKQGSLELVSWKRS